MGFCCGIVGLPNVGKSTLFNALTQAGIAAENYPFCTIEPNVGVVPVPDPRLDRIAERVRPERVVPTTMEFVDIAGLVAGASEGQGLGNQFLAHIRETDAIAQVVRCFDDSDVPHVAGRVDPVTDTATINTELALADLDTVQRARERVERAAKAGGKDARLQLGVLERAAATLDAGDPLRSLALESDEAKRLRDLSLLTLKPVVYVANVGEHGPDPAQLERLQAAAAAEGAPVVQLCCALESELARLAAHDRAELLDAMGLDEPGLNRLIRAGYRLLDLLTFFTAGPKEVRAWTVPAGSTAPEAAGRVHTDMQRGFIRAEVVAYEDFVACGGEAGAKEAGRWRLEGKDYVVADGDVMHFRFNV